MANNIIIFPKKQEDKSLTFKELENATIEQIKMESNEYSESIWSSIIVDMQENGYQIDIDSPVHAASAILILEAICALQYLSKGIDHPLHDIAKEMLET